MLFAKFHRNFVKPTCQATHCDKRIVPVCDRNNRTHKNHCLFEFYNCKQRKLFGRGTEIAYNGPCTATDMVIFKSSIGKKWYFTGKQ